MLCTNGVLATVVPAEANMDHLRITDKLIYLLAFANLYAQNASLTLPPIRNWLILKLCVSTQCPLCQEALGRHSPMWH